ncbi:MAG: LamG domain-containing protein [Candidatus Nanoarchaeia archaeon]|nr:LamG domain-containing protein [Candidatus Nanoarchaeia archaeon]
MGGDGDHVIINSFDLHSLAYQNSSVSVWFKKNSYAGSKMVWSMDNGAFDKTLNIDRLTDNQICAFTGLSYNCHNTNTYGWNHVVLVYNLNSTVATYVNGILLSSGVATAFGASQGYLSIGDNGEGGEEFDGLIDEFSIYNKSLTQQEITDLYASQKAKFIEYSSNSVSGKSLNFDGVDDYSLFGDINSIDGLSKVSVSIWIYPTSADKGILVDDWIYLRYTTNAAFYLYNSSGLGSGYLTFPSYDLNKWHHLVGTYDKDLLENNMKLYLNGVLVSQQNFSGTLRSGVGQLRASLTVGSAGLFKGSMDEFAIYNKSLNADEVKYLYDSKKVKFMEYVSGAKGKGMEFDKNSYVIIPQNPSINLIENQPFSISYWAWLNSNYTGIVSPIMKEWFTTSYGHLVSGDSLHIYTDSDSNSEISFANYFSDYKNKWVFVTQIYDGNKIYVYRNGIYFGESSAGITLTVNTGNLFIGANAVGSYNWLGKLDEVRIYNRALSATEISELYLGEVSNYGCCGNDYNLDNFYSGQIRSSSNFCQNGNYLNQVIDFNKTLCSYYGFNWINNSVNYKTDKSWQWGINGTPLGFNKQSDTFEVVFEKSGHLYPIHLTKATSTTNGDAVFSAKNESWFSFWIYPGENNKSHQLRLIHDYSNVVLFVYFYSNGAIFMSGETGWSTAMAYSPNQWYHVTVHYIRNSTSYIYINNILLGSTKAYNYDINRVDFVTEGGAEWYFDSFIIGNSQAEALANYWPNCCGDDGINDTFYNSSIGSTNNFCQAGTYLSQTIEQNRTLCNYYNFSWINNSINYPAAYTFAVDKTELDLVDYKGDYANNWSNNGVLNGWTVRATAGIYDPFSIIELTNHNYHTSKLHLKGSLIAGKQSQLIKTEMDTIGTEYYQSFYFNPSQNNLNFYLSYLTSSGGSTISSLIIYTDGTIRWRNSAGSYVSTGMSVTPGNEYWILHKHSSATSVDITVYENGVLKGTYNSVTNVISFSAGSVIQNIIAPTDSECYIDSVYLGSSLSNAIKSLGSKERLPEGLSYAVNNGTYPQIISSLDGHHNVLELNDLDALTYSEITLTPATAQTVGVIEFWYRKNILQNDIIYLIDQSGAYVHAGVFGSTFYHDDGTGTKNHGTITANTWYHVKIEFTLTQIKHTINGVSVYGWLPLWNGNTFATGLKYFKLQTQGVALMHKTYIDALDYSWSEDYFDGRNKYAQACCGDDGALDNFYNGTIGNTTNFCEAGNYLNQEIDATPNLCSYYNYTWISASSELMENGTNHIANGLIKINVSSTSAGSGFRLYAKNGSNYLSTNSWYAWDWGFGSGEFYDEIPENVITYKDENQAYISWKIVDRTVACCSGGGG